MVTDFADPACILLVLRAGLPFSGKFLNIPGTFPATAITESPPLRDLEFFVIGCLDGPAFRGIAGHRSVFLSGSRNALSHGGF
jgi:hypothetical protein